MRQIYFLYKKKLEYKFIFYNRRHIDFKQYFLYLCCIKIKILKKFLNLIQFELGKYQFYVETFLDILDDISFVQVTK